jgi:uroporphyrinogen-III synthase
MFVPCRRAPHERLAPSLPQRGRVAAEAEQREAKAAGWGVHGAALTASMRLLITRPQPDAQRTAAVLRQMGHAPVIAPVLRIETVAAEFGPGPFAAVVMTSANAARAVAEHPRLGELTALPVFAVGARTAEAARQAGFAAVAAADGGVAELVRLISSRLRGDRPRLLYLAGEDRAGDIAGALAPHGVAVETVVNYRAAVAPAFAQDLRAALGAGPLDGVLHYSRRSAQAFLAAAEAAGFLTAVLKIQHYCLSEEVAAPLRAAGATVWVAVRPEESALVELLSFGC